MNHDPRRLAGPVILTAVMLALVAGLLGAHAATASSPTASSPTASSPTLESPAPVAAGGGEFELPHVEHLPESERAAIQATIAANIQRLEASGRLTAPRSPGSVALEWPLAAAAGFSDPGYHAVTGYVDHNPAFPGQLQDFACGERTYDTAGGYNHQGTDYYLWPFAWNKMAAGEVTVVAAAPGVIVNKSEGNPDQSCSFNSQQWNAVYVRHADGSIAWYGHLKRDSVTAKAIGDTVAAGEYLGLVGSSGNSTGPHLHLELHDAAYQLIDPYAGSCNTRSAASWWQVQRPYNDSAVNKIMTGRAPVEFAACPSPDLTNEATTFAAGETIYFTAFYRDQMSSQTSTYRLLRPDGTVYVEWHHASPAPFYKLAYWWWAFDFAPDLPAGLWTFEVEFEGTQARHTFTIEPPDGATPSPSATPSVAPTPAATPASPTPESPTPEPTRPWAGEPPDWAALPLVIGAPD